MKSKWARALSALAVAIALPALAGGAQDQRNTPDGEAGRDAGIRAAGPAAQDSAAGQAIFRGRGVCQACHGPDAKGTPLAPDLTDSTWLNIDGSMESIIKLINEGVAKPKNAPAPMPAKGGASLSEEDVRNVATYVFSISRPKG